MKRKIGLLFIFAVMLSLLLTLFTGCGKDQQPTEDDNETDKQVPVYQGMTITSASSTVYAGSYSSDGKYGFNYDKDNGKHNGHFKGDHSEKNEEIDTENPFPDNSENENIEEEIKSSLGVIGSPDTIYYATPGEHIYINIHINNPDSFEIMSFTLNGKKYSSYMFEEGSDMETIVLKYDVGTASGIVEYTIDAIKYIDGTEIKDVIIDGNKTVMAGIRTENQVAANVSGVDIDTNALTFSVNVKDNDSLISFSKGVLKAVIYDGFEIVAEKSLTLGENSVTFEDLKTNTLYQYAVVGYYDDLSGDGFKMNVLHKDAFYTDSVVLFDNITVEQESVSFDFLWHEDHAEKTITALKLYQGDRQIAALDSGANVAGNLLSNNTYTLIAEYENLGKTESIYIEFTTLAKTAPDISIVNPTKTQTSVGFELAETDTDNVGAIARIELVHKNGTVTADATDVRAFANLLSNNTYTVKVTYAYDLNDGEGTHTVTRELAITTDAKAAPDFTISGTSKTQTSLGFAIAVTDVDRVGAITKVELVHGTAVKTLANVTEHTLSELLSNNEYTLRVTYTYDLNDGNGVQSLVEELSAKTNAKATPELSIVNPTKTQTSVGFEINETDVDAVGTITKIELVHKNGTVTADSLDIRAFGGLLSDNTYTVKVTYAYDLNDGEGEHTVTRELAITTDAKAAPDFTISETGKTQTSLGFAIAVTDVDRVGAITKVELVHGTAVKALANVTEHSLSALLSNNEYTLRVTYTYDLNDGTGSKNTEKELTARTNAKATPEISIVSPTKTQDAVGFALAETDTDNVGAITKIELLHKNGTVTADATDVRAFANLLSNNTYTVKVTYAYDLGDGEGEHTVTRELAIKTDAKAAPSFSIGNGDVTTSSIAASYDITDMDDTLSYYKVELYKTGALVTENTDKEINFTKLAYYTDYTVKITYAYDLNDGVGEQTASCDYSFKTLPYIDVLECNIANTSAVAEGETIFMEVMLDNPLGMRIESVVINGKTYGVTGATTSNRIFVEIVYNGQFDGGNTYLKIDKANATLDNTPFTVEPKSEVSDNVFINGKLEVLKIEFVNESLEPIDWAFPSEKVYVLITLDNPTGYTVDSIVQEGTRVYPDCTEGCCEFPTVSALTRLDDNRWYYEVSKTEDGWNTRYLKSLSYSNAYIEKNVTYSDIKGAYYKVKSDEPVYISTPDDLKSMNGGYYYELKNDIDLSDLEWRGADFNGVFEGKGYSIKNMSFLGTVENTHAYLGLFGIGTGIIQNLTLEKATVIAQVTATDGNTYNASCGGFVADAYRVTLRGCEIDEHSYLRVNNTTGEARVGGLVGYSNGGTLNIIDCTNGAGVSATTANNLVSVGGLVGCSRDLIIITNSINNGSINAISTNYEVRAGGLVGFAGYCTLIINTGMNHGSITTTGSSNDYSAYTGGLIGYTDYATVTLYNSRNDGSVALTSIGTAHAGGLIGALGWDSALTVDRCANEGKISVTCGEHHSAFVGGLVGYIGSTTVCVINNSTNNGIIGATGGDAHIGGLMGYGATAVTILGCTNNGSVDATIIGNAYVGGLISYTDDAVTILGSTNSGNISATGSYLVLGGLVGSVNHAASVTITNSYSLTVGNSVYNGDPCTVLQLNSKEFYTDVLGFDEAVWDLSELDVENGKYPKLKNI